MLEMHGISKIYRTDLIETHALRDFSLTVGDGEFVAVTGPSGSGKTTFMNVAGLLETFDTGTYKLDGEDVSRLSDEARSRLRNEKIGFIFQSFNLIPDLDIFDNVDVPLRYRRLTKKDREQRIKSALDVVGLSSRMHHMPSQLSGGQQQRAAIARALAGDPRFLLADEPTGNVDSLMARQVMDLLEQINEMGTTIIMVTHDPELARRAHRNVHIVDGQISDFQPYEPREEPLVQAGRRRRDVAGLSGETHMFGYYLAARLPQPAPQPRPDRADDRRGRARHRGLRDDAHDVPRDVGQPDLVEERRALRRDHGLLGPAAAVRGTRSPSCRRSSSPIATRWRCTRSDIPKHKVIMHKAVGILSVDGQQVKPERVTTRVTTKDFFAMFDVPFQYGGTWTDAADTGPEPVMVISRKMNEKLFGGANSVGKRIRWNDNEFRIVGVRDNWLPLPTFYDVNNGALEEPEDVYIPFGWNAALELHERGQHERLEAGGHQDLPGVPQLRERLDPDVGRAAGRRRARPLPGLPRQLRAANRSRPAATSGRSTTA